MNEKEQQKQLERNRKIKERAEELKKEMGIRKGKKYSEILREKIKADPSYQGYKNTKWWKF